MEGILISSLNTKNPDLLVKNAHNQNPLANGKVVNINILEKRTLFHSISKSHKNIIVLGSGKQTDDSIGNLLKGFYSFRK